MCFDEQERPKRLTPCSKRLPPKDKETTYLVQTDSGYFCSCRWTNNRFGLGAGPNWGWNMMDVPQYSKVVGWGPLPELILGEDEL